MDKFMKKYTEMLLTKRKFYCIICYICNLLENFKLHLLHIETVTAKIATLLHI
jgi:hypothetical protein